MFKKAEKKNLRLRMALCGPAGAGKTYSALSVASAMGGKIAVVDTEHGSASKYADIFDFDTVQPELYDPRQLIDTIKHAEKEGYAHIIIDSLSHYWSGKGGELEMVDNAAARSKTGNTFTAWKTVTPVHNELIETIIGSKINVFVTMRTKTEYVIETVNGKQVPRKVGLAPVMRDGIEYEFDICGDIDQDNNFIVTKSRCPELSGKCFNRPGIKMAELIIVWLSSAPTKEAAPAEMRPVESVTIADKTIGKYKPADEFTPEPGIVELMPPIKAAARPAKADKPAVDVADEIKQVRALAQAYGCKTVEQFKQCMEVAAGRAVEAASALSNDERKKAIEFLTEATKGN